MPTDVDRASPIKSGILLDTLQLVESAGTNAPVPNHLLDTKIYRKIGKGTVVATTPTDVHFPGFRVGKKCITEFCITNVNKDVIQINILPPQSKYFKLHYKKTGCMIPGIKLKCQVEFLPEEWRYYYDCIRINCPGEENVVVPIHAYPVMNTDGFPQYYRIPPIPVGESIQNTFPLSCDVPVDFEFQLKLLQASPEFMVHPMEGIVPANGKVDITVTFTPTEFKTSCIQLELSVSQFNSKPITCTISGSSMPGLQKQRAIQEWMMKTMKEDPESGILDPRCISPLDRSRLRKQVVKKKQNIKQGTKYKAVQIQTVTAQTVAKVLSEKAGHIRAKDLRDALLKGTNSRSQASKQMKEAAFKNSLQQNLSDERQNQLRWQSKIGGEPVSETLKAQIIEKRNLSWEIYSSESDECLDQSHSQTMCLVKRTSRFSTEIPEKLATFDPYKNNLWYHKLYTQQKFIQAVRKIILQNRASKKMVAFRSLMDEWKDNKYADSLVHQCLKSRMLREKSKRQSVLFQMKMTINEYENNFVTVDPPEKLNMRFESIHQESEKQLDVRERSTVPYFDLMVPQHYKLQEYKYYDLQTNSYISPDPSDYYVIKKELVRSVTSAKFLARFTKQSLDEMQGFEKPADSLVQKFKLPQLMLQPMVYPLEHIYNPLPNVQFFEPALPYSEGDADYHLCPIPRFPQANKAKVKYFTTQKKFLNKENVIRGIMVWKKFPSPSLMGLSTMATFGSNWMPIKDDLFKSGILPNNLPPLMSEFPSELGKRENSVKSQIQTHKLIGLLDPAKANLTPEAVNEEFQLASDSEIRRNRYEEEEEFTCRLLTDFDQFGARMQEKMIRFSEVATDQELVLC